MTKDTIAFISTYAHPSRDSVEKMLHSAFPEYKVENFSMLEIVKKNRQWIVPNLYFVVREYGREILQRRATVRERFFQTSFLLKRFRVAMARIIDSQRHVFSFQTQSMYDSSVPGVPHFLYTDHTHLSNLASPYFDRRRLRPPAWLALERRIYHNAACVFTRSSNVTSDLLNRYGVPADGVECVYCGPNAPVSPHFRPDNADYTNRHILFVGGDWERKGGSDLAQAFTKVLSIYPDAHLTIAGASPTLELANCTVLGDVPLDQLTFLYARASIFCVPTRHEPFGIVFLEAMMHRLPIVATQVGALPDMVEEGVTGYLVSPGDADALAQRLIDLLGDPARCKRLGAAGYERAADRYTWAAVGARMRARILPLIGRS